MFLTLLACVAVGATFFVAEALVAGTANWSSLSKAPMVAWCFGAVFGATWGILSARSRLGVAAARTLFLALALALVVQINYRYLPDSRDPMSLAATALLVALVLVGWRMVGKRVAEILERAFGVRPHRVIAGLAGTLLVAVVASYSTKAAQGVVSRWSPREPRLSQSQQDIEGDRKLLLVGIDGARWDIIDPLIEAERMPNLAALVARGRRGILTSSIDSASPVVWTTIMTGRQPAVHGITGWEVAVSTNRRIKALWNITGEAGLATHVQNVPGSYPAEELNGRMIAGFPIPQGSRSNRGWIITDLPSTDPWGPRAVLLSDLTSEPTIVALKDLPPSSPLEETTPYLLVRRLSEPLSREIAHRCCIRTFLNLKIWTEGTGDDRRLYGASDSGEELFALKEGDWGPWLRIRVTGRDLLTRAHAARVRSGEIALFLTALFREDAEGLSSPPDFVASLASVGEPYIAEGTGWQIFFEPVVLGSLEQHQLQLASARAAAAALLMQSVPWDVYIYIFTVTDRIQHSMWKFREPDLYARIPEELADPNRAELFTRHLPTPEEIRSFAEAIDRMYEAVDRWLGNLLQQTSNSTLVVLVSDHGGQGGAHNSAPTAGVHHENGIYLLAGPTVIPRAPGDAELEESLELVDIVPLLLAHLGLPGAKDLPGRVPAGLLPRGADGALLQIPPPVDSYETGIGLESSKVEIDAATEDQLRSLGYLD